MSLLYEKSKSLIRSEFIEDHRCCLILSGRSIPLLFDDNTFDFEFSGTGDLDRSSNPADFASEIRSLRINGLDPSIPPLREIVRKKDHEILHHSDQKQHFNGNLVNKCSVPGYKRELIQNLEPLII